MKINAQQLSFILGITKKDAKIKILRVLRKDGQDYTEVDHEFHTNPVADVEVIEKYEKVPLKLAIENIKNNALTSPAYKKYLLYNYPINKTGVKTIRLPPALRSLLSKEDLQTIEDYWNSHFGMEGIILKP